MSDYLSPKLRQLSRDGWLWRRAGYLAVDAAVAAQAVGQAGVDAGVAGQAGELVQAARLEGEGGVHAQLLVRVVAALVHGVAAPPVRDALPIGAVELVHVTAGGFWLTCRKKKGLQPCGESSVLSEFSLVSVGRICISL